MDHYRLRMSENEFKERVSNMLPQSQEVRTRNNTQLFFRGNGFVFQPESTKPEWTFEGQYEMRDDQMHLAIRYPSPEQPSFNWRKSLKKLGILTLHVILALFLAFSLFLSYWDATFPYLTLLMLLVVVAQMLQIWKHFYANGEKAYWQTRFLDLFSEGEISKLK